MATCDRCGAQESMPYRCRMCGGTFCGDHRLPENHDCPGLEDWNDPEPVFDSGFDDGVDDADSGRGGIAATLDDLTPSAGSVSYLRGNVTFLLLGLMWLTFFAQYVLAPFAGVDTRSRAWFYLFTVTTSHPEYVWTWVTATFSHGGFAHIFVNSLVLYFFGPIVERRVGSKTFAGLFLVSGALASLAQVGGVLLQHPDWYGQPLSPFAGTAVLGASGAIAAILGVLTVLNPNLRIYLWFVIPMPLWIATAGFALISVLWSTVGGIGAGGFAQVAHLAGLGLGLLYGYYLKQQGERAPSQLRFGGGPGGPGGPGRGGGRGPF